MKRVLLLTTILLVMLSVLASCGHTHEFSEWETIKDATCTENGEKVRYCSCGEEQIKAIYSTGHDYINRVCTICGDNINTSCLHTDLTIYPAVEPTCINEGKTEGKTCNSCGEVLIHQSTIAAKGHTKVVDKAIDATCTQSGLIEVAYCGVCNEIITKQEVIPATGHSLEKGKCTLCDYRDPTYGSKGLKYTLSEDGKSYVVKKGTCSDSDIVIPSIYQNLPVKSIGDSAFYFCSSLTSIVIPDSITAIGDGAFRGCDSLTSIDIPDGVTSIGDEAFCGCISLTSIDIPDDVISIGDDAFYFCISLINISVSTENPNYRSIDGSLYSKDGTTLIQYAVGKTDKTFVIPDGVTSIGDNAFCFCSSLTSIDISDSVTSIGNYAFNYCSSLTSIVIPDSVTSIGDDAFSGCRLLTSIVIPDGVTSIGYRAFAWCSSLTSIVIPDGVTSIGYQAFADCISLTDVYYTGTEEEWAAILIGSNNEALADVNIHFNYIPEE